MSIYAISDLHLSFNTNKPMNIFGDIWYDYEKEIQKNWVNTVKEKDIVILPGDFSWETSGQTAVSVGILSGNDLQNIQSRGVLYRDDLVYASYNALFASCKNETFRLCDKLITAGIFTQTELVLAQNSLS